MAQQIHHQHIKKAERMGVQLVANPEHGNVQAYWPSRNLMIFGHDARFALEHMTAAIRIIEKYEGEGHEIALVHDPIDATKVKVMLNRVWLDGSNTPVMWNTIDLASAPEAPMSKIAEDIAAEDPEYAEEARAEFVGANEAHDGSWEHTGKREVPPTPEPNGPNPSEFIEDIVPTIDGVPTNGRAAHRKGFTIVDNPFREQETGDADFDRWEEEWEASADEADAAQSEAKEAEEKAGSIVKSRFRTKYAELGHPTHCGDELAIKLNNLVLNGSKTDIELFKAIMDANAVDMAKYKQEGAGWQGRFRMTGRNKLAKVVHANGGELKLPPYVHDGEPMRMSQEWMETQRFKK